MSTADPGMEAWHAEDGPLIQVSSLNGVYYFIREFLTFMHCSTCKFANTRRPPAAQKVALDY